MPRGGCSIAAQSRSERPAARHPGADGADRRLGAGPRSRAGSRARIRGEVGLPEKAAQTVVRGLGSRLPPRRERRGPGNDRRHRRRRSPGQRCRFGYALRLGRRPGRIRIAESPAVVEQPHRSFQRLPRQPVLKAPSSGNVQGSRAQGCHRTVIDRDRSQRRQGRSAPGRREAGLESRSP